LSATCSRASAAVQAKAVFFCGSWPFERGFLSWAGAKQEIATIVAVTITMRTTGFSGVVKEQLLRMGRLA
jgi:hypothetical protein